MTRPGTSDAPPVRRHDRISLRSLSASLVVLALGCTLTSREDTTGTGDLDPVLREKIHQGRIVYQAHCTACHDTDGDGRPPMRRSNLRKIARELTPERIERSLVEGIGEMPSFPTLSGTEREGVTAFLLEDLLGKPRSR